MSTISYESAEDGDENDIKPQKEKNMAIKKKRR
jgi:hypothetical protein